MFVDCLRRFGVALCFGLALLVLPGAAGAATVKNGRIAFASIRDGHPEIYSMEADGSGQLRLTTGVAGNASPAWSPDGQHIAFSSARDGNSEIYVMDADGQHQVRLTTNSVG